jgi:hypothetical protein
MNNTAIGWGCGVGSPAQDRDRCRALVNAVMNLRVVAPRIYFI